jgi:uncharacterized heparinase superfamily protein
MPISRRITVPDRTAGDAWARELNGFGWLRHLAAAENGNATTATRQFVLDWIKPTARRRAWPEPTVTGGV